MQRWLIIEKKALLILAAKNNRFLKYEYYKRADRIDVYILVYINAIINNRLKQSNIL